MSYTLVSSYAITNKAGVNCNSTAVASGALIQMFAEQAEGEFCMKTRKDWITDWAGISAPIQQAISKGVSARAGMMLLSYDPSGYTSLAEAQTIADMLNDEFSQVVKDLKDKENQSFQA